MKSLNMFLKKLILLLFMTTFVISFGNVVKADEIDYEILLNPRTDEWLGQEYGGILEFTKERGAYKEEATLEEIYQGKAGVNSDPDGFVFCITYNDKLIVMNDMVQDISWNVSTKFTIVEGEPNRYEGLKEWLRACADDPNTPLQIKLFPWGGNIKDSDGNSVGINDAIASANNMEWSKAVSFDVSKTTDGSTLLKAFTGLDDNELAETFVNAQDGTSGDINIANLYSDDEINNVLFPSLNDAIANMIYGFANLLFNIVQDGLKAAGNNSGKLITIDDIVFDKYAGISINFWETARTGSIIDKFKTGINTWYSNFRGIAIACYMITLLYVGVRILLATGSKQQEKYKEMLTSWGTGVIILFFFPNIIKISITINHSIVELISKGKERNVTGSIDFTYPKSAEDSEDAQLAAKAVTKTPFNASSAKVDYMAAMSMSYEQDSSKSITKAFVYLVMIIQFILLLITYYKRLFMTSFLIVIFPIVAFTYVLDKIGDGSAQAFQTWTRELMLNVFMQCFHAVIYVFVMSVIFEGTSASYEGNWILAIVGVTFLFKGEEILRSILGQTSGDTAKSMKDTAAKIGTSIAVTQTVANKITSGASGATRAVRAERQARADRRIARSMRGEEATFLGRTRNMLKEARTGRDKDNDETRGEYLKRVFNARSAQTRPNSWAQQNMRTSNAPNISLPTPPQTDEGRETLEAARIISDPIGEKATPEQLAQAYDIIKKNSGSNNPEVQGIYARMGLSDEQLKMLGEAQVNAARKMLAADTTDPDKYKKTLTEINKELEIHISRILTGSKQNFDSREVITWKRALLSDLSNVSSAQIRAGLSGADGETFLGQNSRKSNALDKAMSSKEREKDLIKRATDLQSLVDVSDREKFSKGLLFAPSVTRLENEETGFNHLTSSAAIHRDRYNRLFEPNDEKREALNQGGANQNDSYEESTFHTMFKGKAKAYRDETAEDLAVLKDFFERSHKTIAELEADESIKGYTAEEIIKRIERMKKKAAENKDIDKILKEELGFDTEETEMIIENLVMMSYPDGAAASTVSEEMDKKRVDSEIEKNVDRDTARMTSSSVERQLAGKRRKKTVKKIRQKVVERKEKEIIHTVRIVGESADGGTSSNAGNSQTRVNSSTYDAQNPGNSQAEIRQDASSSRTNLDPERIQNNSGQGANQSDSENNPHLNTDEDRGRASRTRVDMGQSSEENTSSSGTTREAQRVVSHRYHRTTAGGDMVIDDLFDMLNEHQDMDFRDFSNGSTASQYAHVYGQLHAGDNREKVANIAQDILHGNQERDENLMAERFEGMTAKEYEARAKNATREAFREALQITGTTVGGVTLGVAGGFLNIGMSSSDSMLNEFGAGFVGGAAIAAASSKAAFDGFRETTVKVYNPYDGTYTDVKVNRSGTFFDGQLAPAFDGEKLLTGLKEGEIIELTDPRIAKIRTKVDGMLADAAAKNRKARQDQEAKKKASKFENALNYRESSKK